MKIIDMRIRKYEDIKSLLGGMILFKTVLEQFRKY